MKYGKIWTRIGGGLIDLIVVVVIACVITFCWGLWVAHKGFDNGLTKNEIDYMWNARGVFVGIVVDFLYTVVTQAGKEQATFGQRASDLIIVKSNGERAGALRLIYRYVISIFSSVILKLGYVVAIFTKRKQTIHDLLADTVVIEKEENQNEIKKENLVNSFTKGFSDGMNQSAVKTASINSFTDFILMIFAVVMICFGVYVLFIKLSQ